MRGKKYPVNVLNSEAEDDTPSLSQDENSTKWSHAPPGEATGRAKAQKKQRASEPEQRKSPPRKGSLTWRPCFFPPRPIYLLYLLHFLLLLPPAVKTVAVVTQIRGHIAVHSLFHSLLRSLPCIFLLTQKHSAISSLVDSLASNCDYLRCDGRWNEIKIWGCSRYGRADFNTRILQRWGRVLTRRVESFFFIFFWTSRCPRQVFKTFSAIIRWSDCLERETQIRTLWPIKRKIQARNWSEKE